MKSTTASLIITALASTAIAQPHGHHHHQHPARAAHQHHHKRDLVTEWDTVWVTETVTEVVDGTTTEWFTPTPSAPSTTLATVTSSAGGQFFEGSSAAPSSAPQVVASPPAAETPSSPPAVVAPAPVPTTSSSSSSSVYVAPQPTVAPAESSAPAPVAPEVETSAAPSVAAVSTPAAAANTPAATPNTDSTVNTNTNAASVLGSDFQSGDLTYYTVGLGACGEDDSGKDMSSNIVAMSSETMGSQSNGNPMCGKTIKIYNNANGKTSTGIIRDKCPGCKKGSIDVSQKLFEELADLADGRIDISWNWAS
ncbi:putative allergen asp f7 [Diaporthe ampelina]|uniref:Putative allergen asp f7 n=1 Tax=Diaporthe ampelina TaxID=1214573 RepID=A0A0G2FE90_9PEZI|nr:putative allergen asp f7 [Diaporthe ampelina]